MISAASGIMRKWIGKVGQLHVVAQFHISPYALMQTLSVMPDEQLNEPVSQRSRVTTAGLGQGLFTRISEVL